MISVIFTIAIVIRMYGAYGDGPKCDTPAGDDVKCLHRKIKYIFYYGVMQPLYYG